MNKFEHERAEELRGQMNEAYRTALAAKERGVIKSVQDEVDQDARMAESKYHHWLNAITQIMPAPLGWVAVYRDLDGSGMHTVPVIAYGVQRDGDVVALVQLEDGVQPASRPENYEDVVFLESHALEDRFQTWQKEEDRRLDLADQSQGTGVVPASVVQGALS